MNQTITPATSDVDPTLVRAFNKQFVTGVTVVTTMDGGQPRGLCVNAYASISYDPPVVMVCVQHSSSTHPSLFAATHLGINIMANDQKDIVGIFAGKGEDKFAQVVWTPAPHGSPLIEGASASLEAEIRERFQAKTHTVFIGRVRHVVVGEKEPIVYRAARFYDGGALTELP
ncbi:flavin reductase family protein [Arthrobacter sp. ISL-28]|uniref:flavin reductase family protein n=1 Tax=Arthrobacter sp. ISL-28 TaxID=2819108 RepID=UPI001BE9279C|nr:flavin reductase family protein [Arthrobacter sp. ISL-28]MBT2523065.1 flavin reductase [Arthrobacter sp. ISL-28]